MLFCRVHKKYLESEEDSSYFRIINFCMRIFSFVFWMFLIFTTIILLYFLIIYVGVISTFTIGDNIDIISGNLLHNTTIICNSTAIILNITKIDGNICHIGTSEGFFKHCFFKGLYVIILFIFPFFIIFGFVAMIITTVVGCYIFKKLIKQR